MAFCEIVKDFVGDVSEEIHGIRMPYADRLKKELVEISRDLNNYGCLYRFEDLVFFIEHGCLYVTYYDGDEQIPSFTEEEKAEADRIIKELDVNPCIFLPVHVLGGGNLLEKLIEYYNSIDDAIKKKQDLTHPALVAWRAVKRAQAMKSGCLNFSDPYEKEPGTEVAAIQKIIQEITKEDSIFHERELAFLSIVLGGIPCVEFMSASKRKTTLETFYNNCRYAVDSEDCFPENVEIFYNMEYVEAACKQWFDIVLHLDKYILHSACLNFLIN